MKGERNLDQQTRKEVRTRCQKAKNAAIKKKKSSAK